MKSITFEFAFKLTDRLICLHIGYLFQIYSCHLLFSFKVILSFLFGCFMLTIWRKLSIHLQCRALKQMFFKDVVLSGSIHVAFDDNKLARSLCWKAATELYHACWNGWCYFGIESSSSRPSLLTLCYQIKFSSNSMRFWHMLLLTFITCYTYMF